MRNATIEGRLDMIRDALAIMAESMQLIHRSVSAIEKELDGETECRHKMTEAEKDAHYSAEWASYKAADEAELHAESAAAMGVDNE